jgi:hypothetical protein
MFSILLTFIFNSFYLINIYICNFFKEDCRYFMCQECSRARLIFATRKQDNVRPDLVIKSLWVSTALALILSVPPVCMLLTVLSYTSNILVSGITAFSMHFIILGISPRLCIALSSLFEEEYAFGE